MVGEFFQGSLIVQDFDDHRMQRKLMQTAFKAESLHGYIDSMNNIVRSTLNEWPVQQPMLFYPAVKTLLLDIAAKVFLGTQLDQEGNRINNAFIDFANGANWNTLFVSVLSRNVTAMTLICSATSVAKRRSFTPFMHRPANSPQER
ncbi:MAG: hypothetical protein HOB98_02780 [Gammaproteobacteria bacterium]|jgi:cytochrome P450|nr:hypothetical protein [Gammaproteobacteria bacterium]MBT3867012.1 hypothetical protein [Gammaproteobacteria bacterium]MBT4379687.1 hypothetical protein [Gammaproteobacteria bacterium]MBT4615355.1 hypothetical protein [Gammaproteobacteria bacterium]MBT5199108.1 hypothetical protein [Gammaproteobacteria bacterium]|tara:strand:+ start:116 stop:553 length:438 start_codon:yes stop_codon:yes gene_type:complete